MRLGRVCGNVVSTIKAAGLTRYKLLLVRDVDAADPGSEEDRGVPYVAIDLVGSGDGEIVLVSPRQRRAHRRRHRQRPDRRGDRRHRRTHPTRAHGQLHQALKPGGYDMSRTERIEWPILAVAPSG